MESPSPRPFKRLIVCCDGTGEAGDHTAKRHGSYRSNITRIRRAVAPHAEMSDGTEIPQITYYQSGVGTVSPTVVGRTIAGQY